MKDKQIIISETQAWLKNLVIGLNFCPFAGWEFERGSVYYAVYGHSEIKQHLEKIFNECLVLNDDNGIETTLIIFPESYRDFDEFLELVELANQLLELQNYNGIYQLAHFHPEYCFADVAENDASNFTNRSPYPMLHLIREKSLENALQHYAHPEEIPQQNIKQARRLGYSKLAELLKNCYK